MTANRPVLCEDCGATFTERWRWEPSLPPHNCTERAARRAAARERRTVPEIADEGAVKP